MRIRWPLCVFILAAPLLAGPACARIDYDLSVPESGRDLTVSIKAPTNGQAVVSFQIPTWSPGAYAISDFAQYIADVAAVDENKTRLVVERPDRLTWSVTANKAMTVTLTYTVTNSDVVQENGRPKRAHISGPRVYMYVVDRKQEPVELDIAIPNWWKWKIATSLDQRSKHGISFSGAGGAGSITIHGYAAPNYDVLADSPIEMGDFAYDQFIVRNVTHSIVLYGDDSNVDRVKLKEYCRRVAESQTGFYDDVPFKRYVFMFRCIPIGQGGGGLEHLASTEIVIMGQVTDHTRMVIAHEYFHAWNVKRIRPAVLGPFDYTGPARTKNLWWAEGVTSYYADLLSRRAGILTAEEYLKHLGFTIGKLQNNPARLTVSADESSLKVWDGGGITGFGGLDFYTKGELMGLCLDLKIRAVTDNRRSLDDVTRALYAQCGKGEGPGFAEDDIREMVNRVAGKDLSSFYDRLARSTRELPLAECLDYAGLRASVDRKSASPYFGLFTRWDGNKLHVRVVEPHGPASAAGIRPGDIIARIEGKPVSPEASLFRLPPGKKVMLSVTRDGRALRIPYTVGSLGGGTWKVAAVSSSPVQTRIRESWMGGK